MAKCIKCGRKIEDREEKIFGVIERHHYDDRHDTAAMDTGPTWYKPIALIRIGVCKNCNRSAGKESVKKNVGTFFGGVAITTVAGLTSSKLSSEAVGAVGLLGILMVIFGLVSIVRDVIKKLSKNNAFETSAIDGKLKPEWIIWPPTEESINVTPVPGNLQNRHHFEYIYVGEKKLQKLETGKGKENSKEHALDVLRIKARESRIFS